VSHDHQRVLEVHLFDFDGDLYGIDVEVEFLRFLRGEKKFASVDELRDQIARDIAAVR
jgi:riboflavin kinase/FMN adenylyltransferase